jgi:hypothetical protein
MASVVTESSLVSKAAGAAAGRGSSGPRESALSWTALSDSVRILRKASLDPLDAAVSSAKSADAKAESSLDLVLPQAAATIAITIRNGTISLLILGIIVDTPPDINAAPVRGL